MAAPPPVRRRVFLSGAIYVGGAVGMEVAGALWALSHGHDNLVAAFIDIFEEGGELVGAALFLDAALHYLVLLGPGEMRLADPVTPPAAPEGRGRAAG
jgi:hypothetical protein